MTSDPEGRVGTTVGGAWTLERVVGTGASAIVYAARHPNGNRAAMKVLRRSRMREEDVMIRFMREALLGASVRHPRVVTVHGLGQTEDDVPVINMELLEGENLGMLARRAPLSVARAVAVTIEVLEGVVACHEAGIVHRDLKPENVFVLPDEHVKLLDFGVARGPGRSTTRGRLAIGTPQYMAPEQARGAMTKVDHRSDVFCVGAMLHSLITRVLPRGGADPLASAARDAVRPLSLVAPHVPLALAAIVDRAVAWDPDARWSSAAELRAALLTLDAASLDDAVAWAPEPSYGDRPTAPSTPSAIRAYESVSEVEVDVDVQWMETGSVPPSDPRV